MQIIAPATILRAYNAEQAIRGAVVYGGARLNAGDFVLSPVGVTDKTIAQTRDASPPSGGRYRLEQQTDGNLVLYDLGSGDRHVAIWASNTAGNPGAYSVMQTDGNLVTYRSDGRPLWSSGTAGHGGAVLMVQSDDNLVIYAGVGQGVLWARRDHGSGGFWSGVLDVVQTVGRVGTVLFPISPLAIVDVVSNGPGDALADALVSVKAAGQFVTGNTAGAAATVTAGVVGAAQGEPPAPPAPPVPTATTSPLDPWNTPPPPPPPMRWETPAEWARRVL